MSSIRFKTRRRAHVDISLVARSAQTGNDATMNICHLSLQAAVGM